MNPGPELDLATAVACGIRSPEIINTPSGPRCFRCVPDDETKCIPPIPVSFRPSTDLNDAFLAAEKFGLFKVGKHEAVLLQVGPMDKDLWAVADDADDAGYDYIVQAPTPAWAICAAILKLHKEFGHEDNRLHGQG